MKKNRLTMFILCVFTLSISLFVGCTHTHQYNPNYVPDEGKVHLFIGQDLGAVGGLPDYTDGYIDYFGMPRGITTYTGISDLDGLNNLTNYGSGDVSANAYLEDEHFKDTWMAIGLYMVDDLQNIIDGKYDDNIKKLGEFITAYKNPVFLRIGYEFDGSWNHYDPTQYKQAFQYICDHLDEQNVTNYVSVWQSIETSTQDDVLQWYPGDDYVDWCAYSYFDSDNIGEGMLAFARAHNKPVMIAESTPKRDLLSEDPEEIWSSWYEGFFKHIHENMDVIKAVSYINCRWRTQEMWKNQGWGDSRVQINDYYATRWVKEMQTGIWDYQSLIDSPKAYVKTSEDEYPEGEPMGNQQMAGAIEAEDQEGVGNVKSYDDSYASGGKGMAYIYKNGDLLNFKNMPSCHKVTIRYASNVQEATASDETQGKIGIYLNGERVQDLTFTSTGSWVNSYEEADVTLDIPEGSTFSIGYEDGDCAMNVDCILTE